jgi:hypothetical protein
MRREAQTLPTFDVNTCPVSDSILSRLYRAEPAEIRAIAMDLPELQRMQLAAFCYARSHLREVGREVALVCNTETLTNVAGRGLGASFSHREHIERARVLRPKVTLASRKDMEAHSPWQSVHRSDSEDDV